MASGGGWGNWAAAGAQLIGASQQAKAARDAALMQSQSADKANEMLWAMYSQNRDDQTPWRVGGTMALSQLASGVAPGGEFNRDFTAADFTKDPGYQFRMDEGQKGLERSAAARGGLMNGGTLRALNRYGQDYASGEFNNAYSRWNNNQTTRYNRLSNLAGLGQTANNVTSQLGQQTATAAGNNTMSAGAAQAAGQVGAANAWTGAANNIASMYQLRDIMKQGG